jgi:hypothetical protein
MCSNERVGNVSRIGCNYTPSKQTFSFAYEKLYRLCKKKVEHREENEVKKGSIKKIVEIVTKYLDSASCMQMAAEPTLALTFDQISQLHIIGYLGKNYNSPHKWALSRECVVLHSPLLPPPHRLYT